MDILKTRHIKKIMDLKVWENRGLLSKDTQQQGAATTDTQQSAATKIHPQTQEGAATEGGARGGHTARCAL